MRSHFVLAAAGVALTCGAALAEDKEAFKDDKEKLSYAIGMNIGNNLKRDQLEVSVDQFAAGLREAMTGKTKLTDKECEEFLKGFAQTHAKDLAEKNKKQGDKYLAENKTKEGIKTLTVNVEGKGPVEMQYKVLKEGSGPTPKPTDHVRTHYRGTLVDGTEFDNSYKRGQPATFGVGNVIKGWTEALTRMKVGSQWQLFVPPELGYGETPRGGLIKPNSTLIFDVELLGIDQETPSTGLDLNPVTKPKALPPAPTGKK